ncbi:hypothetical protein K457DRAFT_761330 [Linnemannia elongata AG-77]|uniref:Uncharacterized protein n=1 Tax=Linnemannia elongata AG-77 TaxID=1314771 RepID=A0A197JLN4_9FUNG|nr:hypothetical protein K457DRAFT_761330 [Linnemannia elongata AG-77]
MWSQDPPLLFAPVHYLAHGVLVLLVLPEKGWLSIEIKTKLFQGGRGGGISEGKDLWVKVGGYWGRLEVEWRVFCRSCCCGGDDGGCSHGCEREGGGGGLATGRGRGTASGGFGCR